MRKITRCELSQSTRDTLLRLTTEVVAAADLRSEADRRWRRKPRAEFVEVRERLEEMATGRSRCMYCEDSLGTDIEHFWPKAEYPELTFVWENYLLACSHCNSNLKRNEFPLDAASDPLLLDPTTDDPAEHLAFLPTTGEFASRGPKGPESIRVFGLNDDSRPRRLPTGRKQALIGLVALLKEYDAKEVANPASAAEIKRVIQDFPFSAVLNWLVAAAYARSGATVLGGPVVELVRTHRMDTWV